MRIRCILLLCIGTLSLGSPAVGKSVKELVCHIGPTDLKKSYAPGLPVTLVGPTRDFALKFGKSMMLEQRVADPSLVFEGYKISKFEISRDKHTIDFIAEGERDVFIVNLIHFEEGYRGFMIDGVRHGFNQPQKETLGILCPDINGARS